MDKIYMYIKQIMDMLHINDICFKKSIRVETFTYKIFKTLETLGTIGNDPFSFKLEYHAVTIWQNRDIIQSNN